MIITYFQHCSINGNVTLVGVIFKINLNNTKFICMSIQILNLTLGCFLTSSCISELLQNMKIQLSLYIKIGRFCALHFFFTFIRMYFFYILYWNYVWDSSVTGQDWQHLKCIGICIYNSSFLNRTNLSLIFISL